MNFPVRNLLFYFLLTQSVGCSGALTYSAQSIQAHVVDADTKRPVAGAIVTANWELVTGTFAGGPEVLEEMMIMETTTDANGLFSFPGWGPKLNLHPSGGFRENAPQLLIFKSGYEYWWGYNERPTRDPYNYKSMQQSDWSGKTIELMPFKGNLRNYEEQFEDLNHRIENFVSRDPEECRWKKIPKTIYVIHKEQNRLIKLGVNPDTLDTIYNELLMNDDFYAKKGGCGSPKVFFRGFQE